MDQETEVRALSDEESNSLDPGSKHYRAYVGPPAQYDLMGATQFMLLVTLGLREFNRVLDFGCGSLRAGRLLIPYLNKSCYHGLEPNDWLIRDALQRQLGEAVIDIKEPRFYKFADFNADHCGFDFDYIVAQSIFSHAGPNLMAIALASFGRALNENGLIVLTVLHPERTNGIECQADGWTYPDCISYHPRRLQEMFDAAGLYGRAIPWFHPRQTWYVLSRRKERLPPSSADAFLHGAILNEPEWRDSITSAD